MRCNAVFYCFLTQAAYLILHNNFFSSLLVDEILLFFRSPLFDCSGSYSFHCGPNNRHVINLLFRRVYFGEKSVFLLDFRLLREHEKKTEE